MGNTNKFGLQTSLRKFIFLQFSSWASWKSQSLHYFFFTWPDMGPSCKVPFLRPALWTNCKSHLAPWSVWHCSDKPTSPFGSLRHMVQNSGTEPLRSTQIQGLWQWSKIKNSIWKLLGKTKIFFKSIWSAIDVSNMYDSFWKIIFSRSLNCQIC